jgi:hypothetical protein
MNIKNCFIQAKNDSPHTNIMKSQLTALVATFTLVVSDAFHVHQKDSMMMPYLSMTSPNYNSDTQTTSDTYVFPSIQLQQQEADEKRRNGTSRIGLRKTLKSVATTFATYRELEAAGLLEDNDKIEDANRKAAEKFAAFAQRSKMELDAINNNPNELQSVLIETAAALGRTTGQIFGGKEPENYRD